MWTAARCLAALEGRLPGAFRTEVAFRQPVRLPGRVTFASQVQGRTTTFAVRHEERGTPHLDGTVTPLKRGT